MNKEDLKEHNYNMYFKSSWKFANNFLLYENILNEYNTLKNNIINEYYTENKHYGYNNLDAYRYAIKRLRFSFRLKNKKKELDDAYINKNNSLINYDKYFNIYNN
tara:strand:+ start:11870 stop:12184 length:315 start_codon:yes stop_codon:yes gene_type:complete